MCLGREVFCVPGALPKNCFWVSKPSPNLDILFMLRLGSDPKYKQSISMRAQTETKHKPMISTRDHRKQPKYKRLIFIWTLKASPNANEPVSMEFQTAQSHENALFTFLYRKKFNHKGVTGAQGPPQQYEPATRTPYRCHAQRLLQSWISGPRAKRSSKTNLNYAFAPGAGTFDGNGKQHACSHVNDPRVNKNANCQPSTSLNEYYLHFSIRPSPTHCAAT